MIKIAKAVYERCLHVSSTVENNETVPFIRMRGKWLEKAGFNIGDEYRVNVTQNRLVLTNITEKSIDDIAVMNNGSGIENIVENTEFNKKASQYNKDYLGYTVNLKLERNNNYEPLKLSNSNDVYHFLKPLQDESREVMLSINMNAKNQVLGTYEVAKGGVLGTTISIPEIFKSGLLQNASSIVLAHNHPSGNPEPSSADVALTDKLIEASKLMEMSILDHIIIGYMDNYSMRDKGHIK